MNLCPSCAPLSSSSFSLFSSWLRLPKKSALTSSASMSHPQNRALADSWALMVSERLWKKSKGRRGDSSLCCWPQKVKPSSLHMFSRTSYWKWNSLDWVHACLESYWMTFCGGEGFVSLSTTPQMRTLAKNFELSSKRRKTHWYSNSFEHKARSVGLRLNWGRPRNGKEERTEEDRLEETPPDVSNLDDELNFDWQASCMKRSWLPSDLKHVRS